MLHPLNRSNPNPTQQLPQPLHLPLLRPPTQTPHIDLRQQFSHHLPHNISLLPKAPRQDREILDPFYGLENASEGIHDLLCSLLALLLKDGQRQGSFTLQVQGGAGSLVGGAEIVEEGAEGEFGTAHCFLERVDELGGWEVLAEERVVGGRDLLY